MWSWNSTRLAYCQVEVGGAKVVEREMNISGTPLAPVLMGEKRLREDDYDDKHKEKLD